MPTEKPNYIYCSFCGANQEQVQQLVAGPEANICDVCVDRARDYIGARRIEASELGEYQPPEIEKEVHH